MIALKVKPEGYTAVLSREDSICLGHDSPREKGWKVCPSWASQVEVSGQVHGSSVPRMLLWRKDSLTLDIGRVVPYLDICVLGT